MKQIVFLALVMAHFTAVAQGITIKDFQVGGDLLVQGRRAGMACSKKLLNEFSCYGSDSPATATIAGVKSTGALLLGYDNKLGMVHYGFAYSDFEAVRDAFKLKYPALSCDSEIVQNRMGAKFEKRVCYLNKAGVTLLIQDRDIKLTVGSVQLMTQDYVTASQEAEKRKAAAGKKDI